MTENKKRFTKCDDGTFCLLDNGKGLEYDEVIDLFNELYEENEQLKQELCQQEMEYATEHHHLAEKNEQLKQQKPFLKIHDDYFIQYGDDRELFSLHKPSDIRSLIYLINRENGYDELECEYNEEGYGND